MTILTIGRAAPRRGLRSALGTLGRQMAMAQKIRRDTALLQTMSDYQLQDIGLTRSEIARALRRTR